MEHQKITNTLRAYFKEKGISRKDASLIGGYKNPESFARALSSGVFSKNAAKKLSAAYGFSIKFLLLGEGELFEPAPKPIAPDNTSSLSKKELQLYAWERTGGRCCYCKRPLALDQITVEHIIPQSKFSSKADANTKENTIACCSKCNTAKGNMSIDEFLQSVISQNQSLLQIEKERKELLVKVSTLTQRLYSSKFAYIQYLRQTQKDDSLIDFVTTLKTLR